VAVFAQVDRSTTGARRPLAAVFHYSPWNTVILEYTRHSAFLRCRDHLMNSNFSPRRLAVRLQNSLDGERVLMPDYRTTLTIAWYRMKPRDGLHASLRPLRDHPWAMFFGTLLLFVCSSVFTTRKLLDSQPTGAGDSYASVLNKLWPVGLPNRTDNWENENSKSMHALVRCMSSDTCGTNQKSIVLLSTDHFASSIAGGVSGEDIWSVFFA
jgi:hypothetical protein